jgi:hypothetical protein
MDQETLRYPTGRFDAKVSIEPGQYPALIEVIARTPARMRAAVAGLDDAQLDTPYRDGGWTVRQVVHHVPDSHMNAYIRFKLTLTEDEPLIRTYDEKAWAMLEDSRSTPIPVSLALLEAVHDRWNRILAAMGDAEFDRTLRHPDWGVLSLAAMLRLYAWHGGHHVRHITSLRERCGW